MNDTAQRLSEDLAKRKQDAFNQEREAWKEADRLRNTPVVNAVPVAPIPIPGIGSPLPAPVMTDPSLLPQPVEQVQPVQPVAIPEAKPITNNTSVGGDYGYDLSKQGLELEQQATENILKAEATGAKAKGDALAQSEEKYRAIQKQKEEQVSKIQSDIEKEQDEYKDMKITDPNIWGNASTGGKIMLALGAIFSSANPNSAQAFRDGIQKTIDRDIDLQKSNIAKKKEGIDSKKGSLAELYKKFGDMETAELFFRDNNLKKLEAVTEASVLTEKNLLAKANKEKALGVLAKERQQLRDQMTVKAMEQAGKSKEIGAKLYGQTFDGTDGFEGIARTEKEAQEFRQQQADFKSINSSLDNLGELSKKPFSSINPSDKAKAETEILFLKGQIGKPIMGTLTGGENVLLDKVFRNPTNIFSLSEADRAAYDSLKAKMSGNLENSARSIGLTSTKSKQQDARGSIGAVKK